MDIHVSDCQETTINPIKLHKMVFLYNALENGCAIKKKNNAYIFTKNHEGKKEVFLDDYLKGFMKENFDMKKILDNN